MFIMNQAKIIKAYTEKQKFTYSKILVDFWPQKEDPHQIRITAGGNLIQYKGNVLTQTAELTSSKLLWNSVIST